MGPTRNTQSPRKAGKPEDWTWAHFYKHPDYASRRPPPPETMYSSKPKAFCKRCFDACVDQELLADKARLQTGVLAQERSPDLIARTREYHLCNLFFL